MATINPAVSANRPLALIVDDSHIARYILSCELERLGYEVEVAESAEAAFRQLAQPLPDLIFMDHLLPGIDGLEAVDRLRGQSATSKLPIIMYTSQDGDEFAEQARSVGADDIYVKSADESRLVGILERLNLLPNRPVAAKSSDNVTPFRRQASSRQRSSITREQLARLLEPSLEAHHAKLRQDLLGEFAILERYEERMRRDLFARVETLSRQTGQRLDRDRHAERVERRRRGRRLALAAASFAACMLLVSALGIRLAWDTAARTGGAGAYRYACRTAAGSRRPKRTGRQVDVARQQRAGDFRGRHVDAERRCGTRCRIPVAWHPRPDSCRNQCRCVLRVGERGRARPRECLWTPAELRTVADATGNQERAAIGVRQRVAD